MIAPEQTLRDAAERRRRGRARRRILTGVAVLVAFGLGVALGQALHDNPRPGGAKTTFFTIQPRTRP